MNILITGATGFIGRHLVARLKQEGHQTIAYVRNHHAAEMLLPGTLLTTDLATLTTPIDAVINLAGEPIAAKAWSKARKALLYKSRIDFTQNLLATLKATEQNPYVVISGSAIGYYGAQPIEDCKPLGETDAPTLGFTHSLCADWEQAAQKGANELGARACFIRTGVVLGERGGAIKQMLLPFKLGLGGPIASGEQMMSWIHMADEVDAIMWLLERDQANGPYNLTAPYPVTNQEFASALAERLNRPDWLRTPGFVMKLMLGEGAELVLEGQNVYPQKLIDEGFEFQHPHLKPALAALKL